MKNNSRLIIRMERRWEIVENLSRFRPWNSLVPSLFLQNGSHNLNNSRDQCNMKTAKTGVHQTVHVMCSDRLCFTKVEICYPASEILSGGWIFFGCLQFTTLLMITHFGQLWVWFWLWNSVSSLIGWWITDDGPPMQFFKNNKTAKWKRYGMGSLAFLIVFAFPGVGSSWLNYMLPASRSPCIFRTFSLLTITYT